MQSHVNGTKITVVFLCILVYLLAGYVQADSLPLNLTACPSGGGAMQLSVSDLSPNGTVLLIYESGMEFRFNPTCKSDYFRINNSASELVLNKNLMKYCNDGLACSLHCRQGTDFLINLLISIVRDANYTMEFKEGSYKASVRELTSETEIVSFSDQLTVRGCEEGSLLSSSTFYIDKDPMDPMKDWFTTKQSATAGIVYSTSLVDYEQLNGTTDVKLKIHAEQTLNNGATKLMAYTNLVVKIIDVDDMNPVFTQDVYYLNISEENSALSTNPHNTSPPIEAYDGDRGINDTILYSLKDDMNGQFSISNNSGKISVLKKLDRDGGQDLYVMIIKATQQNNTFRTATSTLSLSVTDIDDNPPTFSPDNYTCNINEHSAVGQVICTVSATDEDKGDNAIFTYDFLNISDVVEIDNISGVIKVKNSQMLDREKEPRIDVQVITKYTNHSIGPSTANVTINLIDINDNSPEFSNSSYEFIVWNKSIGDYIGKIDAFDLDDCDNKKLNYTIGMCLSNTGFCSGDSMKCNFPFQIDPHFGNITLKESSAGCTYSTLVSVCDSPHLSTRCSTTQLIIRVEGNMTNLFKTSAIPENAANNSLVAQIPPQCPGTSIHCDKGDTETVFRVDAVSKMVVTSGYLDYENTSNYNCSVVHRASDNTVMCTVIYNITVLDVNDNAPKFSKDLYFFEIPNNGSVVIGRVSAEDEDENKKQAVTFDIQESSVIDFFLLNSTTGILQAKDVKDLSRDYYHLSIMAQDTGKPPLKSMATVLLSKHAPKDNHVLLRTNFNIDEIESKKSNFERNISEILKVDIKIEKTEPELQKELQGNKIYISARRNVTPLSFEDLLREVLRHYDPLMSYLLGNRGEAQFARGNSSDSGMTAPVIALITIACVVFVCVVIAIIVIRRQYDGHQRYKRLYQNLTSHSSLYESQELKVKLEDETSDYNGSVNTQDLEMSDNNKTGALTSTLNPMYGLDSATSPNVAEAMLSLNELSDRLNEEENVPKPDYENVPSTNVEENLSKPDYENVPLPVEDQDQTEMGELLSTEAPRTSSGLDNVEVLRSESPTPDYDQQDGSNEIVNTALEPNGSTSEPDSEIAANSLNIDNEKNNEKVREEPLPDYDKKQVRFAHQVLDQDENKMTPLKTGDEEGDGDSKEKSDPASEDKKEEGEKSGKRVVPPLDLGKEDTDETKLNVSDETGWLEEEINSPIDVMIVDDKDNEFFEDEVTSL